MEFVAMRDKLIEHFNKMTKDEIILKYYYARISAGVIEKHIDVISGKILENDLHEGSEGKEYNILPKIF